MTKQELYVINSLKGKPIELVASVMSILPELICAVESSGWISVKDNLPKIGEFVLLCDELGYVNTGDREDDEEWFSVTTDLRVTHWMPLPKPPVESCS